jgi:hypothetical protein
VGLGSTCGVVCGRGTGNGVVLGEWQRSARVLFGHGKRGAGHVDAPVTARARVGLSRTRTYVLTTLVVGFRTQE